MFKKTNHIEAIHEEINTISVKVFHELHFQIHDLGVQGKGMYF